MADAPADRGGDKRRTYDPINAPDTFFKDDPASNAELVRRALEAQSRGMAINPYSKKYEAGSLGDRDASILDVLYSPPVPEVTEMEAEDAEGKLNAAKDYTKTYSDDKNWGATSDIKEPLSENPIKIVARRISKRITDSIKGAKLGGVIENPTEEMVDTALKVGKSQSNMPVTDADVEEALGAVERAKEKPKSTLSHKEALDIIAPIKKS